MTTLLDDPEIRTVALRETADPLVPVPRSLAASGRRPVVRAALLHRLLAAQRLLPVGRRLQVVEGHRFPVAQLAIWDRYAAEVALAHPEADAAEQRRLTSRFVSPIEVAPHVAGAAVDLTLADGRGRPLDLGTRIDATPEESGGACCFDADVPPAARVERDLLAHVLTRVGFVNYPTEWWHWSFGDRYWAWATRAPAALYGPVDRVVPVATATRAGIRPEPAVTR